MHSDTSARTMVREGAHQHRPRHDVPTWHRLHWRERAALTAEGVTRAEWSRLPATLRAELLSLIPSAYPAGDDGPRAWERASLRGVRDFLPPDHPRRVLERRDGLLLEARAAAEGADAPAGSGYVDSAWFFDGHAGPSPEEQANAAAHAEAVHRLSVARNRHAATVYALALLILAAVSELLESREAAPRTGPQHRRTDPPEPPPPRQALTCSTLTAAPPVTAPSVPGSRCAVLMAA